MSKSYKKREGKLTISSFYLGGEGVMYHSDHGMQKLVLI